MIFKKKNNLHNNRFKYNKMPQFYHNNGNNINNNITNGGMILIYIEALLLILRWHFSYLYRITHNIIIVLNNNLQFNNNLKNKNRLKRKKIFYKRKVQRR